MKWSVVCPYCGSRGFVEQDLEPRVCPICGRRAEIALVKELPPAPRPVEAARERRRERLTARAAEVVEADPIEVDVSLRAVLAEVTPPLTRREQRLGARLRELAEAKPAHRRPGPLAAAMRQRPERPEPTPPVNPPGRDADKNQGKGR